MLDIMMAGSQHSIEKLTKVYNCDASFLTIGNPKEAVKCRARPVSQLRITLKVAPNCDA